MIVECSFVWMSLFCVSGCLFLRQILICASAAGHRLPGDVFERHLEALIESREVGGATVQLHSCLPPELKPGWSWE